MHQHVGDDVKWMPSFGQNWLHGSTSLQMERLWFVELWPNRSSLQSRVSLTGNGTQLGRTDASYLRTDRCQLILTNAEDYFHKWRRICYYFFLHKLECFKGVSTTEKNRENYVNFSRVCDSQSAVDMSLALFGTINECQRVLFLKRKSRQLLASKMFR